MRDARDTECDDAGGEIAANGSVDYERLARETVRRIGYTDPALGFHDGCEVQVRLVEQSPDVARGVTERSRFARAPGKWSPARRWELATRG